MSGGDHRTSPASNGARLPVTVVVEDPRLPYPYQEGGAFIERDRDDQRRMREALARLPDFRFDFLDDHQSLAAELAARRPGFVFNLCDTGFRNRGELEAHIPALLEMLDIPYSGTSPAGLLQCRDKALVRAVAADLGVPVPAERYLDGPAEGSLDEVPYPALIKPNLEEGSRGITAASVVADPSEAAERIRGLREELPDSPLLLQEFLTGAEYSVGLVGNPGIGLRQLPVLEVDYSRLDADLPPVLAFGYKNDPGSRYGSQLGYRRPQLSAELAEQLARHSRRLFTRLGCRDYARIDYRADAAGTLRLLEVNPNPAWVVDGSLHRMAAAAGHDYPGFLALLLSAGLERHGLRGGAAGTGPRSPE